MEEMTTASKLFGVTDKRVEEIGKTFTTLIQEKKYESWKDVIDHVKREHKLEGESDYMLLGYIFGRLYEEQEHHIKLHKAMEEIDNLMEQLRVETAKSDIKN